MAHKDTCVCTLCHSEGINGHRHLATLQDEMAYYEARANASLDVKDGRHAYWMRRYHTVRALINGTGEES